MLKEIIDGVQETITTAQKTVSDYTRDRITDFLGNLGEEHKIQLN